MNEVIETLQHAIWLLMDKKTGSKNIDEEIDRFIGQISLSKIEIYKFDSYLKKALSKEE